MASESAQQVKLNAKLESLLTAKNGEVQRLKQDITIANAKIIQMANDFQSLKDQVILLPASWLPTSQALVLQQDFIARKESTCLCLPFSRESVSCLISCAAGGIIRG